MKPLSIDFLPPRSVSAGSVLFCALVLAATLATLLCAWSMRRDASVRHFQLENTIQDREATKSKVIESVPARPGAPYYEDASRAAIEASFHTAGALAALEHVEVVGVTPLSIELQADTKISRVEVEFSDQQTLLKYLEELNSGDSQSRWRLLRATARMNGQNLGAAVLEARW